jgi:23S rRNA pseudouridine1911/1915/1917 synthase
MALTQRYLHTDHLIVTHRVGSNQHGIRLDQFLKTHYKSRSREQLKEAIQNGLISIHRNQGPRSQMGRLKPSSQLVGEDVVKVLIQRRAEPPVNFNYRVLHEDETLLILDKPAPLPVHPAGRYFFHTLLTHLRTRGFTLNLPEEGEFFLVHRIDKETSGVLILAKSREVCAGLTEQFRKRTTQKRYIALIHGHLAESPLEVSSPLGKDRHSEIRLKMAHVPLQEGGLSSSTEFKELARYDSFSLIECFPKTGRQHQIRVHLAEIGHPIVGDKLYSIPEKEALRFYEPVSKNSAQDDEQNLAPRDIPPALAEKLLMPRHALHASKVRFQHPLTSETVEFESPLPEDFLSFMEKETPLK